MAFFDSSRGASLVDVNNKILLSRNKTMGRFFHANPSIEKMLTGNGDGSGETSIFNLFKDPTTLGFKIFFHFSDTDGLLADESNINSALAYLKRIGELDRYTLLKRFISHLQKVNSEAPWMFQTIEGLAEVHASKSPFHEEGRLVLGMLETLDWKIQSLIEIYKHIVFDHGRRYVNILPENLREFGMSVYVHEMFYYSNFYPETDGLFFTVENNDIRKINHLLFEFQRCEIDFESGSEFINSINNGEPTQANNNLIINYKHFIPSSLLLTTTGDTKISSSELALKMSSSISQESPFVYTLKRVVGANRLEKIQNINRDALIKKANNLVTQGANSIIDGALNALNNRVNRLLGGNIYGFSPDNILGTLGSTTNNTLGEFIAAGSNVRNGFTETPSLTNTLSRSRTNIYIGNGNV